VSALRTGIVGVGQMGGRMAARVREAGDPIVAYDRDAERLAAGGIEPAGSLEELVTAVDVVLLSLPDSSIIEPLVLTHLAIAPGPAQPANERFECQVLHVAGGRGRHR